MTYIDFNAAIFTDNEIVLRNFERPKEQKSDREHVGRSATTKVFYLNPDPGPQWVEYVPPPLPDSRTAASSEAAAIQVYKVEKLDNLHEPTGKYLAESIRIQSPFLCKELEPILQDYKIHKQNDYLLINWPHRPLYFERNRILKLALTVEDPHTREHLELLCKVINEELGDVIAEVHEMVTKEKEITHDLLWTLFPKDSLVVVNHVECTQGCRVEESKYLDPMEGNPGPRLFIVSVQRIDFDGFRYGYMQKTFEFPKFYGKKLIVDLAVYPYTARTDPEAFRTRLVERGRRLLGFQGVRHMEFSCMPAKLIEISDDKPLMKYLRSDYKEKVIIDALLNTKRNKSWLNKPLSGYSDVQDGVLGALEKASSHRFTIQELVERLPEAEYLTNSEIVARDEKNLFIMSPMLPGFLLGKETWSFFDIDNLVDIKPTSELFDHLFCEKINLMQDLFEGYQTRQETEEAEGLRVLLSGPSGAGKTSMVEAIAEKNGRPLYWVNAHELYEERDILTAATQKVFGRAVHWNAIVLLDDADFFVRDRCTHRDGVYENSVTGFLHELDKFKGILFITTSYLEKINWALESRMHAHIMLPAVPSQPTRAQVWYDLLSQRDLLRLDNVEELVQDLAQWDLGPRQIKNVLTMVYRSPNQNCNLLKLKTFENMIRATCAKAIKEQREEYLFEAGNYVLVGGKESLVTKTIGYK
ncbi:MAG: hypothetical protein MMC33_004651 [Icmadophila ericetorum]|nr:hypothetical protein [Icmadophila ericetorum]